MVTYADSELSTDRVSLIKTASSGRRTLTSLDENNECVADLMLLYRVGSPVVGIYRSNRLPALARSGVNSNKPVATNLSTGWLSTDIVYQLPAIALALTGTD